MKYSIGNKLLASGLIILLFIVLMIIASQIVGGLFKDTSSKLVVEYNELDAIQEFKLSLGNLILPLSSYAVYGNVNDKKYYNILALQAKEKLEVCILVVTERHELELFKEIEVTLFQIDKLASDIYLLRIPDDNQKMKVLLEKSNTEISEGIKLLDLLLNETKLEIEEYVSLNKTVIKHSTITILSLGLLVALIILIGGWLLIKSITKPITELVSATNSISQGERTAKIDITSDNEFRVLAESFNNMVYALDKTTVSKNYLNNILRNMFDALIVTDVNLKIRSTNLATLQMLGYNDDELIGAEIEILFKEELESPINGRINQHGDLKLIKDEINNIDTLKSKSGKIIPVFISCTILKNEKNEIDGLIIVGHDLTQQKFIENKLEQSRRKRLTEINDAEEEERMRIATDLHDGLGQMLTAISYAVQEVERLESKEDIQGKISLIQQQIDRTINEAKNLSHNLIPIVLKDFGLIAAIENLISRANEIHKINFRFDAYDFKERIDPMREKALYRICQESLNNIIKHANAKNATFQLFWQDCSVVLVIEDDGAGFNKSIVEQRSKNSGIGLISMRERVLGFDGNFTINSELGEGTEIIIEIPCPKD